MSWVSKKLCQGINQNPLWSKEHLKRQEPFRSDGSTHQAYAGSGFEGELSRQRSEERSEGDVSNRRNGKAPKHLTQASGGLMANHEN